MKDEVADVSFPVMDASSEVFEHGDVDSRNSLQQTNLKRQKITFHDEIFSGTLAILYDED